MLQNPEKDPPPGLPQTWPWADTLPGSTRGLQLKPRMVTGPAAPPTLPLEGHPAPPCPLLQDVATVMGDPVWRAGPLRPPLCCVTSGRPLGVSEPGIQVDEKREGRLGGRLINGGDLLHPGG